MKTLPTSELYLLPGKSHRFAFLASLLLTGMLQWGWGAAGATPPQPMASASTPASANSEDAAQTPASDSDTAALLEQIRGNLAQAKEDLDNARKAPPALPGGADETEQRSRRAMLRLLVGIGEKQVDHVLNLQALQARCNQLEKELSSWTGFGEPIPSLFLKKEELREAIRSAEERSVSLQAWRAVIEQIEMRRGKAAERVAVQLRQQNEKLEEAAGDPVALTRLYTERDTLMLQNRVAVARVRGSNLEARTVQEKLRETGLRLQLAERQFRALPSATPFTAADLETLKSNLAGERQRIGDEIAQVLGAIQGEEGNRPQPNAAPAKTEGAGVGEAAQHERIESLDLKLQILNWIMDLLRLQEDLWELRWTSAHAQNREEAAEAYTRIDKGQAELQAITQYFEQKRRDLLTSLAEPPGAIDAAMASEKPIEASQAFYLDELASVSRLLGALSSTINFLTRWKEDLDERFRARPLSDRLGDALQKLEQVAAAVWQFEMFAAQDTIEVDGQKISGKRSVTVAKVFTALAILIIGYWVAARLAYLTEQVAVGRFAMKSSHARIARRWLLALSILALAAASLAVVHIPLTIFAFLGGAVAIGAGFGMQNLFKNLISGLMLLIEHPFRPGDLIEVGGIRGRVIDIGMRSSHIRDGNGIETLIPNSTFIEQNVTNWTLSSQLVRISVKVGVAYGSPAQDVTDILLAVAGRHGLVQEKPPPQVLLEDFASDALLFGLYVWLELNPEVDWRVVASDLRFMINKAMSSQGIEIAYPQRDVHLDSEHPLEVRIVADDGDQNTRPHKETVPGDKQRNGRPK